MTTYNFFFFLDPAPHNETIALVNGTTKYFVKAEILGLFRWKDFLDLFWFLSPLPIPDMPTISQLGLHPWKRSTSSERLDRL